MIPTGNGGIKLSRITYVDAPCKSVLNRVKGKGLPFNWSINPYTGCSHACTYCYARAFYLQAERGSAAEFDSLIYVKSNAPAVLRTELARRSWKREMVVVGAATDPYQPAEAKFRITRGILEALRDSRTPVSIITKGPLVLRDIDLLREIRDVAGLEVNMTIPTMDATVSRTLEPHTPPPAARMAAVRKLNDAGIRTGVFMAPILPGIADDQGSIRAVMEAAVAAGAPYCMPVTLRLQPGVREWFLPYISRHFPELTRDYAQLYQRIEAAGPYKQKTLGMAVSLLAELGLDRMPGQMQPGGVKAPELAEVPQQMRLSI
jgi:DNA repair photolyase